ncbi:DUF362 domain-containing protein [Olsenella uli]|uniref:cyclophilin-like fold protein n=1 Tax=Olsenella uli TaxID=133926 RepID=UPI001956ED22|nr:cyclophilin-like fold protein [Olsenella uli]MBM6816155.1 DUF362 domain-containing protein [Olsenella uli]
MSGLTRRTFMGAFAGVAATAALAGCEASAPDAPEAEAEPADNAAAPEAAAPATVYLTRDISPAGLRRAFDALGFSPAGNVAVKLSTGEPGGHNFLSPDLIAGLVQGLDATIVECNTAYGGARGTTESHLRAAADHGFTAIAGVDIMDADGSMSLPVMGGTHLTEDLVGAHLANYDSVVSLAHFKGHAMGGFGGAIKNCSIGIAAREGKMLIHSAGASTTGWGSPAQDDFLESMAEAAKAVSDYFGGVGGAMAYVNVMNRLSVDCDCDSHPAEPEMADIGILASTDPVALDRACVDLVYAAADGAALVERIESRNGTHTLDHAEAIGLGTQTYELVDLDEAPEEETMTINVTCAGQTVTYELNDSVAARGLVGQLPLTLEVTPFGSNEQTFYPPEALDCSDAPLAAGGAGVLAYYEPWGDVVMFYDDFSRNGSLYELGHATAGTVAIAGMAGTIEVTRT